MTLKELKKIVDNAYKNKSARNNEIKLWIWDKQDEIGSASFTYECDNITGNLQYRTREEIDYEFCIRGDVRYKKENGTYVDVKKGVKKND